MSRHRTAVILGGLALLPGGCRETVWLDLRVVRQSASTAVAQVRVEVYSPPTAARSSLPGALRDLGERLDLRLVSEVPSAPLRVRVDAYRAASPAVPVLRQEYLITLPNRGGGVLQVVLWDACVGRDPCPASQTCGSDGTCVPMQVLEVPASDAGWVAPERCGALTCAGFRDAGAGMDATPDAAADATADAIADTATDAGRVCPGPSATAVPGWTACNGVWCPTACDGTSGRCLHVTALGASRANACSLHTDGTVRCWGRRAFGLLGDGVDHGDTTEVSPRPTPVVTPQADTSLGPVRGATGLTVGAAGACVEFPAGSSRCWGFPGGDPSNTENSLRNSASAREVARLTMAAGEVVREVSVGARISCGIVGVRREVVCTSDVLADSVYVTAFVRERGAGDAGAGRLVGVDEVRCGDRFACARRGGEVLCWGDNGRSALGRGVAMPAYDEDAAPVASLRDAVRVVTGDDFACALRAGGRVSCWGNSYSGRCGRRDGTQESADGSEAFLSPVEVVGTEVLMAQGVAEIDAEGDKVCVVLARDHSIQCWGDNTTGQLGIDTSVGERWGLETLPAGVSPVALADAELLTLGGGSSNSSTGQGCARQRGDCRVFCWGLSSGDAADAGITDPWRARPLRW
jgi:hypothetical protein